MTVLSPVVRSLHDNHPHRIGTGPTSVIHTGIYLSTYVDPYSRLPIGVQMSRTRVYLGYTPTPQR